MTDKFEPGAKVYFSSPMGRYSGPEYIEKVYKTGNFTLVGRSGQYKADGRQAGTIKGSFDSIKLVLATPDVEREVNRQKLIHKSSISMEWFFKTRNEMSDADLQSIVDLQKEIHARMVTEKTCREVKDNG